MAALLFMMASLLALFPGVTVAPVQDILAFTPKFPTSPVGSPNVQLLMCLLSVLTCTPQVDKQVGRVEFDGVQVFFIHVPTTVLSVKRPFLKINYSLLKQSWR